MSQSAIRRAQNILFFQLLLSKHLKNTCEKGYFLVKLQVKGYFRYAVIVLNISAENLAKQFSCRKNRYFCSMAASDDKTFYSMSRQIVSVCLKLAFNNAFILNINKIKCSRKTAKHQHSLVVNITKIPGIKLTRNLFVKLYIHSNQDPPQKHCSRVDTGIGLCFFRILIILMKIWF